MREVLGELHWTARHNAAGIAAGADPEFLHQFRVSLRGTRAMIPRAMELYETSLLEQLRAQLKWLSSPTGHARDLDVLTIVLSGYGQNLPVELFPHVELLERHAARRAHQATLEVAELLASRRFYETMSAWEELVRSPGPAKPKARRSARKVAMRWVRQRHRAVWLATRDLSSKAPLRDLHRLRLDLKKLRYQIDFYAALLPPKATRRLVRVVRLGQDILGTLNDTATHEHLIGVVAEDVLRYRLGGVQTVLAAGQIQGHLQEAHTAERRRFKAWREDFLKTKKLVSRSF